MERHRRQACECQFIGGMVGGVVWVWCGSGVMGWVSLTCHRSTGHEPPLWYDHGLNKHKHKHKNPQNPL